MLLFEPSLLFHMRQLLSEITSSSDLVISQLEAGPGRAIMRPNMKEEVQEVGLADTELIIQVIKCTFHNVHNMWQGLITDVLGCNSKIQTQDRYNIQVWLWMNWRQYQELLGILCGIIADPHQRRNLPVSTLSQKISKFSWMKSVMSCNILNDLWWPVVS